MNTQIKDRPNTDTYVSRPQPVRTDNKATEAPAPTADRKSRWIAVAAAIGLTAAALAAAYLFPSNSLGLLSVTSEASTNEASTNESPAFDSPGGNSLNMPAAGVRSPATTGGSNGNDSPSGNSLNLPPRAA